MFFFISPLILSLMLAVPVATFHLIGIVYYHRPLHTVNFSCSASISYYCEINFHSGPFWILKKMLRSK